MFLNIFLYKKTKKYPKHNQQLPNKYPKFAHPHANLESTLFNPLITHPPEGLSNNKFSSPGHAQGSKGSPNALADHTIATPQ